MADSRRQLGAWGERFAADYLERAGYEIVARGWRCARGEIDVVAAWGETLVIVEVRARRGDARGSAEESVTPAKQRRLALLTESYLEARRLAGAPWPGPYRIDVIAIALDRAGALLRLNHLEAAVGADGW
ncbi:MAG TPA: YraN family protein [Herpetosiphonaceae bacterium]